MSVRRLGCLFAVTTLYLGAAGSVLAADLPQAAPVYKAPAAAPAYSWTGWYAGVSAGYGWSDGNVGLAGTPIAFLDIPGAAQTLAASVAALPPVLKTDAKGFIAGGQIGYNFQTDRFVWGVETDLSWSDIKGSATQSGTVPVFPGFSLADTATADERLDWFGTVRGRLGYLIMDPLLVYATGGFAYGHAKSSTTVAAAFVPPLGVAFQTAFGSGAATMTGWTVGAGLEYAFAPRWSLKGEYLYYDLGSLNYSSTLTSALIPAGPVFTTTAVNLHAEFKGSIARVGINYRFDWARY